MNNQEYSQLDEIFFSVNEIYTAWDDGKISHDTAILRMRKKAQFFLKNTVSKTGESK